MNYKKTFLFVAVLAFAALVMVGSRAVFAEASPHDDADNSMGNSYGPAMDQNGGGAQSAAPGVMGTVSSVDGTTLTVTGFGRPDSASSTNTATTTYSVDASGATVMKDNATSTVSAIAVGDAVTVRGTVSGTSITATSIFDGKFGVERGAFGGGRIGSSTSFSDASGTYGRFGEGDRPSGTATSSRVRDENRKSPMASSTFSPASSTLQERNGEKDNHARGIKGIVDSIDGMTLTIDSIGFTTSTSGMSTTTITYVVDASGATVMKDNATSTVSAIVSGNTVEVEGSISGSSIVATKIIDDVSTSTSPEQQGSGDGGGFFGWIKNIFGFGSASSSASTSPADIVSSTATSSYKQGSGDNSGDGGGFFGWFKNMFHF
jgi:membrane-bound inhibitor of C-type lysozyme